MSNPNDPSIDPNNAIDSAPAETPEAPQTPAAPEFAAPAAPTAPAAPEFAAPAAPAAPEFAAPTTPAPQYAAPAAPQYAAAPQYVAAAPAKTNTLAIISMIASIVGLFSYGILSVAGVIMGHISLKQIKRTGEGGRGMALAGLIVGYVGIAIWVVVIILFIIGFAFLAASGNLSSY